ncbi:hypothetical protein K2173_021044 [Erythroxylum novogranatense]|uniref:adenylate kinase n=1 Tax=Erythroxylum novogranatense TaxID=1862640 RepID=A0AAV8TQB3_9ROSI|nr:hypothetical protein K2173_021044 [Erythroxylum novogranatense]
MSGLTRLRFSGAPSALCRLGRCISEGRTFGSAAAVQYDYDDDEYFSEAEEGNGQLRKDAGWLQASLESAEGSKWVRGVQWVLIGEPGARKHVYAEKLSTLLEVPHISMSTLLRQELNPHSPVYKEVAKAINEGKLVPEDVIFGLLSKRLEEGYHKGETGFILDGIPRTRVQAEILDQITDIDLVVNFKCGEEQMASRNFLSMGSSGGASIAADAGAASKEKFRIYAEQGKALEDYYRKQKKLLDFQMKGTPTETWQGLLAALRLKHINAISSSPKLAA